MKALNWKHSPFKAMSALLIALFVVAPAFAQEIKEGTHYTVLPQPVPTTNPNKIEVVEVFSWTCPHCLRFEPFAKKIEAELPEYAYFEKVPMAMGGDSPNHAQAFYTLKAMGELDKVNDVLFVTLTQRRERLNDQAAMTNFVAKHGVDPIVFNKVFTSFGIVSQVKQAYSRILGYKHFGTPSLYVNGKYHVSGTEVRTHADMVPVIMYLVEKEQQLKQAAQTEAAE